jgi:hypothetical protein
MFRFLKRFNLQESILTYAPFKGGTMFITPYGCRLTTYISTKGVFSMCEGYTKLALLVAILWTNMAIERYLEGYV